MLNKECQEMLKSKDVIFEIFAYANMRREAVGAENVYDFSLGNPSVPAPEQVTSSLLHTTEEISPMALHSYSPSGGVPQVRRQIAEDLNRRYGSHYEPRHIFMTSGAAAALAHALRAVTNPGDEVLTFAPHFSEYGPYVAGTGAHLTVVPADPETFQINFEEMLRLISPLTSAVLINSPNNPSGIVYSTPTILRLAEILTEKSAEYGHPIFLITDEPYRDIIFQGTDSPYVANFYANTLTCYSFSKSLSLPGERIGYVAVNPDSPYANDLLALIPQVSRLTGHNGAASLIQRAVGETCSLTSDLSVYETNRNILVKALREYGYSLVEPGGTFYMFPRSLEPDAKAFCRRAMEMDLMLVPGDGFGCPGHFRIAYCVPTEMVERSLPVFKKLAESYR